MAPTTKLTAVTALSRPRSNRLTDTGRDPLLVGLRNLGHTVSFAAQSSGVSTIIRKPKAGYLDKVLEGGADPRREGIALGDTLE